MNKIKSAYEILKGDEELTNILNSINYNLNRLQNFERETSDVNYAICCHGRHHTLFVVSVAEYILSALSYDEHTVELGKIAALLHDIGNYYGRNNHAEVSAAMCLNFISKTNLKLNDLKIITQAIFDHSTGTDIQSTVGAALIIADKLPDIERGIPVKYDKPVDVNSKYNIKDIQLNIKNQDLIFNYVVEGNIKDFINEYLIVRLKRQPIILTQKAADYLNCNCIYTINGDGFLGES